MAPRLGKDKLTVRQRRLAKLLAEGKTVADAAVAAGYPGARETARVRASQDLRNGYVVAAIDKALDAAGCSINKTARVVAEAHDAKETRFFQREGEVVDSRDVIDHGTRLKGAELASRLRKLIGPKPED